MSKKIIAMIPARGGSKGIKKKNIFPVLSKALIEYTIDAASASKYIDEIHLNTDDDEIINVCRKYTINCHYKRSAQLAQDGTSMVETTLEWLHTLEQKPDILVLLQPTSPLRTTKLIDDAINSFMDIKCQSLVGVNNMVEHPFKCIKKCDDTWHYLAMPENAVNCRQDYDNNFYVINGSIYIVKVDWFLKNKTFVEKGKTHLFITSREEGIDVDELIDIYYVEAILNHRKDLHNK